jgi:hypothetical protein
MQTLARLFLRVMMALTPLLVVPSAQASQDLYRPSEPADVVVYGHVIVTLRSTILATSAQERATAASGHVSYRFGRQWHRNHARQGSAFSTYTT